MLSPEITLLLVLGYLVLNGVVGIICGAFRCDRSSLLRTTYDERDVIGGLLCLGFVTAVVLL